MCGRSSVIYEIQQLIRNLYAIIIIKYTPNLRSVCVYLVIVMGIIIGSIHVEREIARKTDKENRNELITQKITYC